ncbi:putative dehydrogenase [Bradyrhizobium sp. LM6.11]
MRDSQLGIGVVGYGYWGPNLVRNFSINPAARVVSVSDLDPGRLGAIRQVYPGISTTPRYDDLLKDASIDAIAIATPVHTHYELAIAALRAGKHVLVEKPLAPSTELVSRLIDEADRRGLTLMVDHTFLYTPAVQKIRELLLKGELGDIYYYDSIRSSLGLFQKDVNVIWDLAVHDISIINHILDEEPVAVSATGSCHVAGSPENMAHITLFFPNAMRGPRQRQLALACQGTPDVHWWQQEDDRLRRS